MDMVCITFNSTGNKRWHLGTRIHGYIYPHYLLLEGEDDADTSIDRIEEPSLCLVLNGEDSMLSLLMQPNPRQQLRHIARTKDLVDCTKPLRALFR